MLHAVIFFVIGLILLIKGGDWFVDGAVGIAKRYRIPEILIGATVVSIGTTIPEVMVSSIAAFAGQSQTAYGNAIGSIICNTSLICAITMAFSPSDVDIKTLKLPVFFFVIATVIYSFCAYFFGAFFRVTGIILLSLFVIYMIISTKKAISSGSEAEMSEEDNEDQKPLWKDLLLLVGGAVLIAFGANELVDNGKIIAAGLGVPESVIALTFIALGTSLPELVTAITSLIKKHSSLSLGNIIGANLFNLVLVSGAAITIRPFSVPAEKLIKGMNASLVVDIPLMFLVSILLIVPTFVTKKVKRWQGVVLLCIYAAYCVFQFLG
ncbi:MAG: calcium/sodium antiporter [Sphaerochaetaceae bacterium]|nr:calcium/sodium antiporter [Sphaerochaetaceae bacterium]